MLTDASNPTESFPFPALCAGLTTLSGQAHCHLPKQRDPRKVLVPMQRLPVPPSVRSVVQIGKAIGMGG
jgi:hypothetical protein